LNDFKPQLGKLKCAIYEINKILYDIHYESTDDFELSPNVAGILNKLDEIPEWWKAKYDIPANDPRWINLTEEIAYEDYTRHIAGVLLKVLKERFGYKQNIQDSVMSKTPEQLKEEIVNVQKWIAEDNEVLSNAINKVGSENKEALEKEIFGKVLTEQEKEDLIKQKMVEVVHRHFGQSNSETEYNV
jgi:hypothetical protein